MTTLKQLQEKMIDEFDSEFPNSRGVFENNDPYDSRRNAIKSFLHQQTALAFEAGKTEATAMVLKEIDHDSSHFCKKYGGQFKECARCYIERILQAKE